MKLELRKTFQFEAAHLLPRLPKTHFSCCDDPALAAAIAAAHRPWWVLCGIEAHVCVLQSALGYTSETPRLQMLQNSQFVDARVELFVKQGSQVWAKLAEYPIQRQLLTR